MKTIHPAIEASTIGIVLACMTAVLLSGCIALYLQPKGRLTCASFGSYADAYNAFQAGASWLDGNHNGIPCENLYHASSSYLTRNI